ncbi:MAG: hypothetical protein ACJ8G3_06865 [Burkholderiaceae bacterium]
MKQRRNETQFIRIRRGIKLKSIRLSANQSVGDQKQITALLARMSKHFPEVTEDWQTGGRPRLALAAFFEVLAMMSTLSLTGALPPYLEGLLLALHKFNFSMYRKIARAIGAAVDPRLNSSGRAPAPSRYSPAVS